MKVIVEYTTEVTVYREVELEDETVLKSHAVDPRYPPEKDLYLLLTKDLKPDNIEFNDALRNIRYRTVENP